jgi:hypothetical protein
MNQFVPELTMTLELFLKFLFTPKVHHKFKCQKIFQNTNQKSSERRKPNQEHWTWTKDEKSRGHGVVKAILPKISSA